MFIVSKRNFLVRRADGTSYLVKKDYVGDVPDDVFGSRLIQGAMKTGLVIAVQSHKDKDLIAADEEAQKKQGAADIRPDAKASEEDQKPESEEDQKPEKAKQTKSKK